MFTYEQPHQSWWYIYTHPWDIYIFFQNIMFTYEQTTPIMVISSTDKAKVRVVSNIYISQIRTDKAYFELYLMISCSIILKTVRLIILVTESKRMRYITPFLLILSCSVKWLWSKVLMFLSGSRGGRRAVKGDDGVKDVQLFHANCKFKNVGRMCSGCSVFYTSRELSQTKGKSKAKKADSVEGKMSKATMRFWEVGTGNSWVGLPQPPPPHQPLLSYSCNRWLPFPISLAKHLSSLFVFLLAFQGSNYIFNLCS